MKASGEPAPSHYLINGSDFQLPAGAVAMPAIQDRVALKVAGYLNDLSLQTSVRISRA